MGMFLTYLPSNHKYSASAVYTFIFICFNTIRNDMQLILYYALLVLSITIDTTRKYPVLYALFLKAKLSVKLSAIYFMEKLL